MESVVIDSVSYFIRRRATKGREYALYAKSVWKDRGVGYEDVFAEGGGECSVLGLTDFSATVEWLDDFLGLETRF